MYENCKNIYQTVKVWILMKMMQNDWKGNLLQSTTGGYYCWHATVPLFRCWCDFTKKKRKGAQKNTHCSFLQKITFLYKVTWFVTFVCEIFLFDAFLCFLHSKLSYIRAFFISILYYNTCLCNQDSTVYSSMWIELVYLLYSYHRYKVYSYFGQDSADIKIDNVTSSRIWSRNSALAQASSGDSILVGFN